MSDQLEKLLAQKPMKEPAKGWRNWWRHKIDWESRDGEILKAGQIHNGKTVWPSKDVAETKAAKWFVDFKNSNPHRYCEHLGAFPEGERP